MSDAEFWQKQRRDRRSLIECAATCFAIKVVGLPVRNDYWRNSAGQLLMACFAHVMSRYARGARLLDQQRAMQMLREASSDTWAELSASRHEPERLVGRQMLALPASQSAAVLAVARHYLEAFLARQHAAHPSNCDPEPPAESLVPPSYGDPE